MDILRFITAGSVDDGKSTLIGRLLYDSKSILADQLEALQKQSKNREDGEIDLALLTDGLRAEREQGITIDVAYKYFNTPKRKFIIADAPGHIQYTRNMVTGASNSNCIVILVDARNGVIEQTRRHSIIAANSTCRCCHQQNGLSELFQGRIQQHSYLLCKSGDSTGFERYYLLT